jgi:hypothetical protein
MKPAEIAIIFLNLCILGLCIAILTSKKEWYENTVTQAKKLRDALKPRSPYSPIVGGRPKKDVRPKKENYTYTRNEPKKSENEQYFLLGQKQACNACLA